MTRFATNYTLQLYDSLSQVICPFDISVVFLLGLIFQPHKAKQTLASCYINSLNSLYYELNYLQINRNDSDFSSSCECDDLVFLLRGRKLFGVTLRRQAPAGRGQ